MFSTTGKAMYRIEITSFVESGWIWATPLMLFLKPEAAMIESGNALGYIKRSEEKRIYEKKAVSE